MLIFNILLFVVNTTFFVVNLAAGKYAWAGLNGAAAILLLVAIWKYDR